MPLGDAILTGLQGVGNFLSGQAGAKRQAKENMKLAKYQNAFNERMLDKQLAWNSPEAQMRRFEDAGLNKNLIYGQGNPGNQSAPLTSADVKPADFQSAFQSLVPFLNQSALTASQVQAINAKTVKTTLEQQVVKLQASVMAKNPLLDTQGFQAIIDSLILTAQQKAADTQSSIYRSQIEESNLRVRKKESDFFMQHGDDKMMAELNLLWQRFKLGEADQKIKAEILTSKEFANAISELELKFIKDFEINGNQIFTFIRLLLMKL